MERPFTPITLTPVDEALRPVRATPARDGSGHYDAKCPACRHGSYLRRVAVGDVPDADPELVTEELAAGAEFVLVCPQPDCGRRTTVTVDAEPTDGN